MQKGRLAGELADFPNLFRPNHVDEDESLQVPRRFASWNATCALSASSRRNGCRSSQEEILLEAQQAELEVERVGAQACETVPGGRWARAPNGSCRRPSRRPSPGPGLAPAAQARRVRQRLMGRRAAGPAAVRPATRTGTATEGLGQGQRGGLRERWRVQLQGWGRCGGRGG